MSPSRAPPTGPSAATNGTTTFSAAASSTSPTTTTTTTTGTASGTASGAASLPSKVGPHPGHIASSSQYTSESTLRRAQRTHNSDPAREDTYRLQGVQLIDNVREHLQLPLRTFATACVYYHRFRLSFRDAEYNYQDAALASLFVACKVEDTIKKSRDILAAAYNVKNPDKPAAADDKLFESPGKIIIGLERLILETIGFDFRTRYPQKLLAKTIRTILSSSSMSTDNDNKSFFTTAYAMSIDMYKTFVPIKRTTFAMVAAVTELTALMLSHVQGQADGREDERVRKCRDFARRKKGHGGRPAVLETMLDLLDLYVQHHKSTKLGAIFDINRFMDIKIHLNKELESSSLSRHLGHCPRCEFAVTNSSTTASSSSANPNSAGPGSSSSAAAAAAQSSSNVPTSTTSSLTGSRASGATMRFVFDPEAAKSEKETVDEFFKEEFEEYEIEVDEPIPPPPPAAPQAPRRDDGGGGGGGRGGRRFHGGGGGGGHRDRWGGNGGGGGGHPHPGGGYRGDRHHRGRGRRH